MIPPGECTYAGRKRRKPVQKRRPTMGAERSNPSKRHRDRLNAELDHLASLLPFPPDIVSKLDKLSVLRLSVSYLRVKSFFQALQETRPAGAFSPRECPHGGCPVQEGRLLLESLNGFALVVSAEGLIFYASATIVDFLGFHQTDVMHQNIYDYIHVDDRQDFCRQLHWAMDPPLAELGQPLHSHTDDTVLGRLLRAQEGGAGSPTEYSAFLTRCFVCRVRCLLDSTSGFLTMQFQGKLKFLFGQRKKGPSGAALPPQLSLFCTVVPVILPSAAEMKMKSTFLRAKHRADITPLMDTRAKGTTSLCESELHRKPNYLAGRSNGENGPSMFRAQTDGSHWTRALPRAPCLCYRAGPGLVLDPEGTIGDQEEEEQDGLLSSSSRARGRRAMLRCNRGSEVPAPARHLSWVTEQRGQEGGTRLRLQPSRSEPLPTRAIAHCTGSQAVFGGSGVAPFRESSDCSPSAYSSRMSRPLRDVHQGLAHPPTCHVPQGSLGTWLPRPGAQHFTAGGCCTEDSKFPGLPLPAGGPCNPVLSVEVPIKVEDDSGSQDTADGYTLSRVWLGTSDVAKRHLVPLPARVPLKTEPNYGPQVCTPHLRHNVQGSHPHSRAPARPCRALAPLYPVHCACLEPEPPPHPSTPGHSECQHLALGYNCRAPGATPEVKREPLDSPPWAAPSQGPMPTMFPKGVSVTLLPPRASEGVFLS